MDVNARAAIQLIVAVLAFEPVRVRATPDLVVAAAAEELILAAAAHEQIIRAGYRSLRVHRVSRPAPRIARHLVTLVILVRRKRFLDGDDLRDPLLDPIVEKRHAALRLVFGEPQ